MDLQRNGPDGGLPRVLMPPYVVLRDVFDEETVSGMLDYALSNEGLFAHTRVGHEGSTLRLGRRWACAISDRTATC